MTFCAPICCLAKRQLLDTACSVCRHTTLAYAISLYDEVDACSSKHDHSEPPHAENLKNRRVSQKWTLRVFLFS